MDGLVGHERDRTIYRSRAQRASYHCAIRASSTYTCKNLKDFGAHGPGCGRSKCPLGLSLVSVQFDGACRTYSGRRWR
ncbi:hypothetical protein Y032_0043g766 [Ancylostoma ceylanicum]|uniref:Uncharacterized protein n=1 Tax=Ancylostoma ceylanicum TaxID=53326 RepID=A0A016UFB0_9BILA|nr:hypothetical protein Y032_0043g766 [Ancylostoma ceylanicum]